MKEEERGMMKCEREDIQKRERGDMDEKGTRVQRERERGERRKERREERDVNQKLRETTEKGNI